MGQGDFGAHAGRAGLAGKGGLLVRRIGRAGLDRVPGPGRILSIGTAGGGQGHSGDSDGEGEQAHGKPLESDAE